MSEHTAEKDAPARHEFCGVNDPHRAHWRGSLLCYGVGATDLSGRVMPPTEMPTEADFPSEVARALMDDERADR